MKAQRFKLLTIISLTTSLFSVYASAEDIYTSFFSENAVGGYDTVAYFTENKAVEGNKDIALEYKGVTWLFSSEKNKALFLKNPETYRPQYGGYCAWAVAVKKNKAPGRPQYWRIIDNKLYLNYSERVQNDWLKDTASFIEQANKYWPKIQEN